jgi:hypothetical protein
MGLKRSNLKRLLQVDVIESLLLPKLDGYNVLNAFSAKVNVLDYEVATSLLVGADLGTLGIVAKKLSLTIDPKGHEFFPTDIVRSLFRRVATLGHVEELKVGFTRHNDQFRVRNIPPSVVEALLHAVNANDNLRVFDLSTNEYDDLPWNPHWITILKGLEGHSGLNTFRLSVQDSVLGPDYSYLRELLSHSRGITVTDGNGRIYTDGLLVDELYSLNRFYRGSTDLVVEAPSESERSLLVATALVERASRDFQRSALVLSDHVDALHELIRYSRVIELHEDDFVPASVQDDLRKRRRMT